MRARAEGWLETQDDLTLALHSPMHHKSPSSYSGTSFYEKKRAPAATY